MNVPSLPEMAASGPNFGTGTPMELIVIAILVPIALGVYFVSKS